MSDLIHRHFIKSPMAVGVYSDWANICLKRNYREPFAVPEQV